MPWADVNVVACAENVWAKEVGQSMPGLTSIGD